MTASWCLTCLVNERVALDTEAVHRLFAINDVALLVGDWTRQDPALTNFLRANGREGVPVYLYFPAHAGNLVTLPQVLTAGTVVRRSTAALVEARTGHRRAASSTSHS